MSRGQFGPRHSQPGYVEKSPCLSGYFFLFDVFNNFFCGVNIWFSTFLNGFWTHQTPVRITLFTIK